MIDETMLVSPIFTTTLWPLFKHLETYRIILCFSPLVGSLSLGSQSMNLCCHLLRRAMLHRVKITKFMNEHFPC